MLEKRYGKNTIWVVDDNEEIIYSFTSILMKYPGFRLVHVVSAREVDAKEGDIVFLDLIGTDAKKLFPEDGVRVYRMTGGFDKADLHKPFSSKDLIKLIEGPNPPSSTAKVA